MSRGWTWKDENAEHDFDGLRALLDGLAQRWSMLTTQEERLGWERQARLEENGEPDFDTMEEAQAMHQIVEARERIRVATHQAEVAAIEAELDRHGARMMRPYEHWNEDEQLVAWQERDRD